MAYSFLYRTQQVFAATEKSSLKASPSSRILLTPFINKTLLAPQAWATFAACCGLTFFPSLLYRTLGGGARFRLPSRDRTLQLLISSHPYVLMFAKEGASRTYRTIFP
jgi:hypothetical protein